jgi:hypothetical protein
MATYAEAQATWLKVYRITERERVKVRITKAFDDRESGTGANFVQNIMVPYIDSIVSVAVPERTYIVTSGWSWPFFCLEVIK